ncbi:unnamed protein product [Natator depressus]
MAPLSSPAPPQPPWEGSGGGMLSGLSYSRSLAGPRGPATLYAVGVAGALGVGALAGVAVQAGGGGSAGRGQKRPVGAVATDSRDVCKVVAQGEETETEKP